ncbi:MAG: M15 family metallopeptidase [Proteobacteria bacterium]|nr:M15 family metallopeptidase [Pseudomonadota bacterium]
MPSQPAYNSQPLPEGFVYLRDIDPTILEEVRYAVSHNFMGRPMPGYLAPVIILTEAAALALKALQAEIRPFGLSLKVYDAYRPQDAVDSFTTWANDLNDQVTKNEFYPGINKKDVFDLGYIGKRSGHTRGSTVDLTLVPLPVPPQPIWKSGDPVLDGRLPRGQRFADNSIDMGSGFDCLDEIAHTHNPHIPVEARANRLLLLNLMTKHGFNPYDKEWWHFTLKDEPYPDTYFNFPVA